MRAALLFLTLTASSCANAFCFNEVGAFYGIAPVVLQSIAEHESRMNPNLVLKNKNGSVDVGLMGINSINFPELKSKGIDIERLKEPCVSVIAGGYLLKKKVMKHGYNWRAVGAYHSETPEYTMKYMNFIQRKVSKKVARNG